MRTKLLVSLVLASVAAVAAGDELVIPDFALAWPGKDGNRWSSEVFLTNPGPTTVNVSNGRFIPGVLQIGVPCYPPIAAFHPVPAYSTVPISASDLSLALECPLAALGGLAFDADGPIEITSRVVNDRGVAAAGPALAGLGQEVPAFASGDLTGAGVIHQLPALLFDPLRCDRPALFEVYLYIVNPGNAPVDVTLQRNHDGNGDELIINGVSTPTPVTITLPGPGWRQLKVEPGGTRPAVCGSPVVADLFFSATGGVAAIASVVDRTSQDARTVLPVRTSP